MRGNVVLREDRKAARREALRAGDLEGLVGGIRVVAAAFIFVDQVVVFTMLKDIVFKHLVARTEKRRLGRECVEIRGGIEPERIAAGGRPKHNVFSRSRIVNRLGSPRRNSWIAAQSANPLVGPIDEIRRVPESASVFLPHRPRGIGIHQDKGSILFAQDRGVADRLGGHARGDHRLVVVQRVPL